LSREVVAVKDNDVEVAGEAAVLEAVVEYVNAGAGILTLGESSGFVAIGPYIDRNVGGTGDQDRLITIARAGAFGIDTDYA